MFYGQQDQFADPTFVSKVAAGLRTAGRTSDVKVYDGAGNGFNFVAGSSPAMRLATGDAGRRTREFLARYLR